jgi:hypothetical protein
MKFKTGAAYFQKTAYDSLGRKTATYRGFDLDESDYADCDDVAGDTVVEQNEAAFDLTGNVIQRANYVRKHDASATGALTTSIARATYTASWYDGTGRPIAIADYGTNGGGAFSRPSTAPSRSDTVLVAEIEYDIAAMAYNSN